MQEGRSYVAVVGKNRRKVLFGSKKRFAEIMPHDNGQSLRNTLSPIWFNPYPWIVLIRPHHWVKNIFVFAGLLFTQGWHDTTLGVQVTDAFMAFCLMSSFVYVINDMVDLTADITHPGKCYRPLAKGTISLRSAGVVAVLCLIGSVVLATIAGQKVLIIVSAYAVLNMFYSFWLKHVVILDVFVIAMGFMLRLAAGTLGVGIDPSKWLIICSLMLTLFLGFAKRRAELSIRSDHSRRLLAHYTLPMLDKMISIVASATIVTYALYTVDAETVQFHGTDHLVYTVPVVMYAMFRYLYLLHYHGQGEDPATDLFRDRHILGSLLIWGALVIGILR